MGMRLGKRFYFIILTTFVVTFNFAFFTALRAEETQPKDAVGYYERGNAKHKNGDYDGAIADFTEAIRLDPKHILAYKNRGNARLRTH